MDVLPLLERLVSIDSVNPAFGGPGEGEIAAFVADWARDAGLDVEVEEAAPGRPNVIAIARGSGGGKTLLLNGHLDTVGLDGMDEPAPRSRTAAVRTRRLRHEGRARGLPGHGRGGREARAARRRRRHRGGRRGAVVDRHTVRAQARPRRRGDRRRADGDARRDRPQGLRRVRDRDARPRGARLTARISASTRSRRWATSWSGWSRSTGHCASIRATRCSAPARSIRASSRAARRSRSTRTAACSRPSGGRCRASRSTRSRPRSRGCSTGSATPTTTSRAAGAWSPPGIPTRSAGPRRSSGWSASTRARREPVGAAFWTDAALIGESMIPTVVFGPGGEGAHADVEWVSLEDVERCAAVFLSVATEFCG